VTSVEQAQPAGQFAQIAQATVAGGRYRSAVTVADALVADELHARGRSRLAVDLRVAHVKRLLWCQAQTLRGQHQHLGVRLGVLHIGGSDHRVDVRVELEVAHEGGHVRSAVGGDRQAILGA
jgi:hypothetical protein